jgi:sugar phosphate isomerase/epimerase
MMKLGFRAFDLFQSNWKQLFAFAKDNGFDSIQLNKVTEDDIPLIQQEMDETGISISSISAAMSWKMLGPDQAQSLMDQENTKQKIRIASKLGAPFVSQFAGNNPEVSFADNLATFKTVFEPLTYAAEEHGVKLVIENCPLVKGIPPVIHNFAYSPSSWDSIFEVIPSDALGLEFDTAHPPYVGIDIGRCIREYAAKIYHVHLKDCKLKEEDMYRYGRLGHEFYEYGVPGDGDIDFNMVVSELTDIGYDGHLTLDLRPTTVDTIVKGAQYMKQIMKH